MQVPRYRRASAGNPARCDRRSASGRQCHGDQFREMSAPWRPRHTCDRSRRRETDHGTGVRDNPESWNTPAGDRKSQRQRVAATTTGFRAVCAWVELRHSMSGRRLRHGDYRITIAVRSRFDGVGHHRGHIARRRHGHGALFQVSETRWMTRRNPLTPRPLWLPPTERYGWPFSGAASKVAV